MQYEKELLTFNRNIIFKPKHCSANNIIIFTLYTLYTFCYINSTMLNQRFWLHIDSVYHLMPLKNFVHIVLVPKQKKKHNKNI